MILGLDPIATVNIDWVMVVTTVVAAVAGYFFRKPSNPPNVPPVIPPIDPSKPGQFPILELLLKLLAERFRIPIPGGASPETAVYETTPKSAMEAELASLRMSVQALQKSLEAVAPKPTSS